MSSTAGRPISRRSPDDHTVVGDGKYHRIEAMPFVDGVFVPDGRTGRVQVDSAGHVFTEFPESPPRDGLPRLGGRRDSRTVPPVRTVLDGIDYASSGHGLLFLHANKGITFDLDAIRARTPATAWCDSAPWPRNSPARRPQLADIWVLVDGRMRFERWKITRDSGTFVVLVPTQRERSFSDAWQPPTAAMASVAIALCLAIRGWNCGRPQLPPAQIPRTWHSNGEVDRGTWR